MKLKRIFALKYGSVQPFFMCGIVGLIGSPQASREAFLGLTTLQHRGQDGAGILTYDHHGFHQVKNLGLVENVFDKEDIDSLTGNLCVAHNRYSTVGRGDLTDIQPFLLTNPFGLGLVHNGNLVNHEELAVMLKKKSKRNLSTRSDSEVLLNLLADGLEKSSNHEQKLSFEEIKSTVQAVFESAFGSYSIATLIADQGLLAFRDPLGNRPLVLGKKKGNLPTGDAWMVASESVALRFNGYEVVDNLKPGEVIFINLEGKVFREVLVQSERKHCMFEWVYFASPESIIDQIPVYGSRIQLGKKLAQLVKKEIESKRMTPDMIVPVPETSRIAAIALAEDVGVPYREVLIKNRYIKRTFILDSQDKRDSAVNLKLSPVSSEIKGKNILLVDDSIVRGTTSRKLIELVRKAGAKEVYFVSTCPPIRYPCYYGIDFPNGNELIAYEKDIDQIKNELGADGLVYIEIDQLKKAILDASEVKNDFTPCMACLDGKYPSDISSGVQFAAKRSQDRNLNQSSKQNGDSK